MVSRLADLGPEAPTKFKDQPKPMGKSGETSNAPYFS